MQVTLVQHEIETAISQYVRSIFEIKEGMEITMTFKATRGDTGNTAFVDILPAGSTPSVSQQNKTSSKLRLGLAEAIAKAKEGAGEVAIADSAEPATAEEPVPEPEEVITLNETGQLAQASSVAEEVEEQQPEPKKMSLFGHLKKPVNA